MRKDLAMSNIEKSLGCRNIGLILKDYSFISQNLSRNVGATPFADRDQWGAKCGEIANPYYNEYELATYEANPFRSTSSSYMEFISKVYDEAPSFTDTSHFQGTLRTFKFGDTVETILNGIQSFITGNHSRTAPASSFFNGYASKENYVGVVRNYNLQEPELNPNGAVPDTLLANYGAVFRGVAAMRGMSQWGLEGVYADYSPVSSRMAQYSFTEDNYGYGFNKNFGGYGMSVQGMTHIDNRVKSPVYDSATFLSIGYPSSLDSYEDYYVDLGWKSKYYWSNSMSYVLNGTKAGPAELNLQAPVSFPEKLPDNVRVYPFDRTLPSRQEYNSYGFQFISVFNKYTQKPEISTGRLTHDREKTRFADNTNILRQYAEKDDERFGHDAILRAIDDGEDEDYNAFETSPSNQHDFKENGVVRSQGEKGRTDLIGKTGQAHVFKGLRGEHMPYHDLLALTDEAFQQGNYESLVARFHTSNKDGKERQETQTAVSENFGLSHGRNLLKGGVTCDNPTYSNGYSNPYCRVWTYHHQYHTFYNLLRGGGVWGKELSKLLKTDAQRLPFRAIGNGRTGFMDGQDSLDNLSVLNHSNNLVNITPKSDGEKNFPTQRTMLSIENLAWRDNSKFDNNPNYYSRLKKNQIGPLGGRIMWFPPYDVSINEDVNSEWSSAGKFIGRGEEVKVWTGARRSGRVKFKMLIDHPSILNYFPKGDRAYGGPQIGTLPEGVDDTGSTEQTILRFFAGCEVMASLPPKEVKEPEPKTEVKTGELKKTPQKKIRFCVFYPNNYSGVDIKDRYPESEGPASALLYLVNGIGTQQYVNLDGTDAIAERSLSASVPNWLPCSLLTKYEVCHAEVSGDNLRLFDYRDEKQGYKSGTLVKGIKGSYEEQLIYAISGETTKEDGKLQSAYTYLNQVEPIFDLRSPTFQGYEMWRIDDEGKQQGISRVNNENYRLFYPAQSNDKTLSGNVTPIFLAVQRNDIHDDHVYYMPVVDGHRDWGTNGLNTHNNWLYQVDHTSYTSTSSKSKKHSEEILTKHRDYADTCSYGLNCLDGLETVSKGIFNGEFTSAETEEGDVIWTNKEDTQLVSFADFMYAAETMRCPEVQAPSFDEVNLKEGIQFNVNNFNVVLEALRKSGCTITISGCSNYHGVSNKTSDSTKKASEDNGANSMLAKHRAQIVEDYIKMVISANRDALPNCDFKRDTFQSHPITKSDNKELVSSLDAKMWRCAICDISFPSAEDDGEAVSWKEEKTTMYGIDGSMKTKIVRTTYDRNGVMVTQDTMDSDEHIPLNDNTSVAEADEKMSSVSTRTTGDTRYEDEYEFFKTIEHNQPFLRDKIREKIQNFDPAYHSMSPEGFNARLTFLQQCCRQGPTFEADNSMNASNLAFGRPPVCVLRVGDFWYSRVLINSVGISYPQDGGWDLNPEGAGVQPMMAEINISFDFIGGHDLGGPVPRLQNATSFNYYANARVYDDRAEQIDYEGHQNPYEFKFVPNQYQDQAR